jgi:hypothetical protein
MYTTFSEIVFRQPSTCSTMTVRVSGLALCSSETKPASDHLVSVVFSVRGNNVKRIKGAAKIALTAAPHNPNSQPIYERRVESGVAAGK